MEKPKGLKSEPDIYFKYSDQTPLGAPLYLNSALWLSQKTQTYLQAKGQISATYAYSLY